MLAQVSLQGVAIVLLVAFGPPALFAASIAAAKRYRKEPGHALRAAFLWGAIGAAFISLVVNSLAGEAFVRPYLGDGFTSLAVAIVIAPLVEETTKPLAFRLRSVGRHTDEVVDGLIYGAIAGLGFSATENLFYELNALATGGREGYIATAIARTFSSSLLHATATAITGYGVARWFTRKGTIFGVVGFWFLAVLLHAAFNAIASFSPVYGILPLAALAIFGFLRVRKRIHALSLVAPTDTWHPIGPVQPPLHPQPPVLYAPAHERRRPREERETWYPIGDDDERR